MEAEIEKYSRLDCQNPAGFYYKLFMDGRRVKNAMEDIIKNLQF